MLATALDRLGLIDEYQASSLQPRIAGHGPTLYQSGLPEHATPGTRLGDAAPQRRGGHALPARLTRRRLFRLRPSPSNGSRPDLSRPPTAARPARIACGSTSTMNELLPSLPRLTAFLAAAFVLAVTPGPGVVYIVTRTLSQGRACGLASVAGVALGNFFNAAAASIGMAALLAASGSAFEVVKYAGAAYLCYLGFRALRSGPSRATEVAAASSHWQVLGQGFVVALLNPKTTLFFAAFLPQFMEPTAAPMPQALALGAIFVATAAVSDSGYVLLASALSPALRSARGTLGIGRYFAATVFFALGIYAAVSGLRPGRA
jgi:threonine/homoserine/homoserine lactone efflux protein